MQTLFLEAFGTLSEDTDLPIIDAQAEDLYSVGSIDGLAVHDYDRSAAHNYRNVAQWTVVNRRSGGINRRRRHIPYRMGTGGFRRKG